MEIEEENQIVDNFSSDEEDNVGSHDEEDSNYSDIIDHSYNQYIYNFNYVYSYFTKHEIMLTKYKCPFCYSYMNITNENTFLDRICFRCKRTNPKHDTKVSIRKNSIFEDIKIDLISIYFIIYECIINNISSNKAKVEFNEFKKHIEVRETSIQNINKLYRIVRNTIKKKFHANWKNEPLCYINNDGDIPRCEIICMKKFLNL